jgi:putative ubiquitin-RnfH superfamily antitoxin RatB of RatAB toxin-antitoxin module
MNIELAYASAPRRVNTLALIVPTACTVDQALAASGWLRTFPELATLPVGIWNLKAARDAVLREGDRVEFYRALRVDPKVARRERFVGQGSRGAGLFSRRRPGSKAGY